MPAMCRGRVALLGAYIRYLCWGITVQRIDAVTIGITPVLIFISFLSHAKGQYRQVVHQVQ